MDISSILLVVMVFLTATVICVLLFQRLGFGSIMGFIVAGVIIGPHTPGPVPLHAVEELQSVAEFGVVLFMFVVGLEMRPERVWAMRRLIFGLGSAQMIATASLVAAYLLLATQLTWQSAAIVSLALAMSSTAIVMATLGERGEQATEHGRTSFAILMAQDLWIVPVMALVPILAHTAGQPSELMLWEKLLRIVGVVAGILVVGRHILPAALAYCAARRQLDAFRLILFLAVIAAAWTVDNVGISMTLGAFVLGMMLSASDLRYQVEASVDLFKQTLMGLFFIAVGMSIDVGALLEDWQALLVHVPVVLVIKGLVLITLTLAFSISRDAAVRTGFYLSQVGEFAFVLLTTAAAAGLLSERGHTLAMLVVAVSMITTPLMVKTGDGLARRLRKSPAPASAAQPAADLDRHVVIVGFNEVGQLIELMLEKADIPHMVVDQDLDYVRRGTASGREVLWGDMFSATTQSAAGLARAAAIFVTSRETDRAKKLAITLHRLYPGLNVYVRVDTLAEQDELAAKGIRHAGTGYIESTLNRGAALLQDCGVSRDELNSLLEALRRDSYALVRGTFEQSPAR
jgi:glutathione-regulated potassium-efflux system protein KefB